MPEKPLENTYYQVLCSPRVHYTFAQHLHPFPNFTNCISVNEEMYTPGAARVEHCGSR